MRPEPKGLKTQPVIGVGLSSDSLLDNQIPGSLTQDIRVMENN